MFLSRQAAFDNSIPRDAVSESYVYNNASQVTSHTANGVTETFTCDALNGMLSDAQAVGTVSYAYDAYGRRN